jgi:hypothetical protein
VVAWLLQQQQLLLLLPQLLAPGSSQLQLTVMPKCSFGSMLVHWQVVLAHSKVDVGKKLRCM